jgi:hypothetical protein
MNRTIGPHMVQAICMLDASTADQRMRVTADDAVGPLEILYDFGVSLDHMAFVCLCVYMYMYMYMCMCCCWALSS